MTSIKSIEGIGEVYQVKLQGAGISTVESLLEACATPAGRDKLAAATDVSEKLILKWANHADLYRINGVAGEYAELLEASGVDTIPELAQRKAENLHAKMIEVNAAKELVRKLPTEDQVADWIDQAKKLPRILNY